MASISSRLDRLPFFRFHARLLVIGGLGYLFDALDVGIIAFVLPLLKSQWHLTLQQLGILGAASSFGGLFGALAAGVLGDRFGRRVIIVWSLGLFCIASLFNALVAGWGAFLVWRVIAGIGTSAQSAIVAPYLSEFAAPGFRGRYIGALTSFFSFGFLTAAVTGFALIPLGTDAWRFMLVVPTLPLVALIWLRRNLPESPRWLETHGFEAEALNVVCSIEGEYLQVSGRQMLAVESLDATRLANSKPQRGHAPVSKSLSMSMIVWFAVGFTYYAFFTWMPSLMIGHGLSMRLSYVFSIAIYASQMPGYFLGAYYNDKIGRRAVIVIFVSGAIAASLILALFSRTVVMVSGAMLLSLCLNATYAGLYAYTPELFPTRIRSTAHGISSAVARVGAVLSPICVASVYPLFGFSGVFDMCAAILFFGAAAVYLLGVATRNTPLEEIQEQSY